MDSRHSVLPGLLGPAEALPLFSGLPQDMVARVRLPQDLVARVRKEVQPLSHSVVMPPQFTPSLSVKMKGSFLDLKFCNYLIIYALF